jgi:hypothetical protein
MSILSLLDDLMGVGPTPLSRRFMGVSIDNGSLSGG